MSRFALLVLSGVFATQLAIFAASAGAEQSRQDKNIDLTELTPSLESQLYEAKRLNRAESESPAVFELNKLDADGEQQRYEMLAGSQDGDGGPSRMVSLVRDPAAAASVWLDRARLTPNNLRRRSNERSTAQANYNNNYNNNNNDRGQSQRGGGLNPATSQAAVAAAGARGQESSPLVMLSQRSSSKQAAQQSSAAAAAAAAAAQAWARDTNRDYDELNGPQSAASLAIDNQESASRRSLWTSDLLRDLLIAQEARTRARYLDQLARNYERERAKDSAAGNGGSVNPKSGWFWQTTRRDKRRRCKVDPNLGVKNPSFCDTDAYFGAADYGTRDVWGDAGR